MTVYCTPSQVDSFSQIAYGQLGFSGTAAYGSFLSGTLIPAAQKIIDNYVDHNFQSNIGTLLLDGNGKRVLIIHPPYVPVLSAGTVKVNDVNVTSNIKTYSTYLAYEGGVFTEDASNRQNVQVTLAYGYDEVPSDVQYVAAQIAANILADMLRRKLMPDTVAKAMQSNAETVIVTGMAKNAVIMATSELRGILDGYRFSRLDVT